MRAKEEQAYELTPLLKRLWPEHPTEELTRILKGYISGTQSAVFAEYREGKPVGVALCCLRHDYVEGCDTSPVGYLEGIFVQEAYRSQGVARALCRECESWATCTWSTARHSRHCVSIAARLALHTRQPRL